MSISLNECNFIGNTTRDVELRNTPGGQSVADFGMVVNESWKKDDEWKEKTTFLNLQAWNGVGERAARDLSKGDKVFIRARFAIEEWNDKTTGEKRSTPRFTVIDFWKLERGAKRESSAKNVKAEVEDDEEIPF